MQMQGQDGYLPSGMRWTMLDGEIQGGRGLGLKLRWILYRCSLQKGSTGFVSTVIMSILNGALKGVYISLRDHSVEGTAWSGI